MSSDALQERFGGDAQAALRSTLGVFTRQQSSQQSSQPGIEVNIRGMSGFGRVNAMIDGVPQTFRNVRDMHLPADHCCMYSRSCWAVLMCAKALSVALPVWAR